MDFSKVVTFNLDECMICFIYFSLYFALMQLIVDLGLSPQHDQSYHYFMWENLFKRM